MATTNERNLFLVDDSVDDDDPLDDEKVDLIWEDHHRNFFRRVSSLCAAQSLTDVTISCENTLFEAHQLILSASSEYFKNIFSKKSDKAIIIYLKNVQAAAFQAILSFIYNGEVQIQQDNLKGVLDVAKEFQIEGICQIEEKEDVVEEMKQLTPEENQMGIIDDNIFNPINADKEQLNRRKHQMDIIYDNIPDLRNDDKEQLSHRENQMELIYDNIPDLRSDDKEQLSPRENPMEIIYDKIPDPRNDDIEMKKVQDYMKVSDSNKLFKYNDIVEAIRDMENTKNEIQNITYKDSEEAQVTDNTEEHFAVSSKTIKVENASHEKQNIYPENQNVNLDKTICSKISTENEWLDKFESNFESYIIKYMEPGNDMLKSIKDVSIREHIILKSDQIVEIIDAICNYVFSKVGKKIPSITIWRRLASILQSNIPKTFQKAQQIAIDDDLHTLEELFLRNYSKCLKKSTVWPSNSQELLRKLEDNFDDLIPEAKFVKNIGVLNSISHNQILRQICHQISKEIGPTKPPPFAIFQNIVSTLTKKMPQFYCSTPNPVYTMVKIEDGSKKKMRGGLVKLEKTLQSKFYEKYRRNNQNGEKRSYVRKHKLGE